MTPRGVSVPPHHVFCHYSCSRLTPRKLTVSPSGRNLPGKPLEVQFALKDLLPLAGFRWMEGAW